MKVKDPVLIELLNKHVEAKIAKLWGNLGELQKEYNHPYLTTWEKSGNGCYQAKLMIEGIRPILPQTIIRRTIRVNSQGQVDM